MALQVTPFMLETSLLLVAAFFLGFFIAVPARQILRRSFISGQASNSAQTLEAVSDDGIVRGAGGAATTSSAAGETAASAPPEEQQQVVEQSTAALSDVPSESVEPTSQEQSKAEGGPVQAPGQDNVRRDDGTIDVAPDVPTTAKASAEDVVDETEITKPEGEGGDEKNAAKLVSEQGEVIHSEPGDITAKPKRRSRWSWLLD